MKLFRTDRQLTPSWDLVPISFGLVKSNIWAVIYLSLLPTLLVSIGSTLLGAGSNHATGVRLLGAIGLILVGVVWLIATAPGLIYLELQAVQGRTPSAMDSFRRGTPLILKYIQLLLILGLVLTFGFLAFIIPGLILLRGLLLAYFYMIDKNLTVTAALKQSFAASKPHAGYIWGIIGVSFLFSLVSFSLGRLPIVGPLLSLGISSIFMFAPALRYSEIELKLDPKSLKVV